MHVACAQVLQSWGTREQISPLPQLGQAGVSGGHSTQRLKMVRSVFSTSALILVFCIVVALDVAAFLPLLLSAMFAAASSRSHAALFSSQLLPDT